MKKDIHPKEYRTVLFEDISSGEQFLIGSTIKTTETATIKGTEYPKIKVEISSASHPYYTGTENILDSAGRVEKFKLRAQASRDKKAKK